MACQTPEAALGISSKLGFVVSNPGSPPSAVTSQIEFDSESIVLREMREDTAGIRGTRGTASDRVVSVRRMVEGSFSARPTPLDLLEWIPRITGGSFTGSSGTLQVSAIAETTPCFDVFKLIDGLGFKYRECLVQGATFRGSECGVLSLTVDVIGRDRDDPPASYSWPGGVSFTAGKPFVFSGVTLEIPESGTTYRVFDFSMSIQNQYEARFANSVTPTDMITNGRSISLGLNLPWGTSEALLSTFRAGGESVLLRAEYVSGSTTYTLEFETAHAEPMELTDPAIAGKGEIKWDLGLNFKYVPPAAATTQLTTRLKSS